MKIIKLLGIITAVITMYSQNVYSCDDVKEVNDCDNVSEYTWNPAKTSEKLNRFYDLDALIMQQYKQGNYEATKELVAEYLALAAIYKNNWNYGNAIHDANRVLGLIRYQQKQYDEATQYLIKAGQSPGSPQLDSFGPNLDLANVLLKAGETAGVKTYLLGIQQFWKMDNGVVNAWLTAIDSGEVLELDRFGSLHMGFFQKLISWIGLAWPVIAALGCFFFYKRKNLSPWKFIPVAIVVGYVVMVGSGAIASLAMVGLMNSLPATMVTPMIVVIVILAQFGLPLVAITLLSNAAKLRRA